MCGIAGAYADKAASKVSLMLSELIHRGPNNSQKWSVSDQLSLGHTRLAINDLTSAGNQPMLSPDMQVGIAVNGEIYNYQLLKQELKKLGCIFNSHCDSEVVLHAYLTWGKNCFIKLNGMFAIAIIDKRTNEILLVRDRLGIKPIYYHYDNNHLYFASEIKSLHKIVSECSSKINLVGLKQYLTYQNMFGSTTLFSNIKLLEQGSIFSYKIGGSSYLTKYWEPTYNYKANKISFNEAVDRYQSIFTQSVQRHLISDVPIATYLSSGFDSSSVTAKTFELGEHPVCYTGCFGENGWYDESTTAAKIAHKNGTEHIKVLITPSDFEKSFDNIISQLDEPRMSMGSFPQYFVAKKVAERHKVVLTGHGGDELFSGYPVFKFANLLSKFNPYKLKAFKISELPHAFYFLMANFKSEEHQNFLPVLFTSHLLNSALNNNIKKYTQEITAYEELAKLNQGLTNIEDKLYNTYIKAYLNGLLIVEDKISMAHSIESRTPILDNEMLELSMQIDPNIKLYGNNLKSIVKEGGKKFLPIEVYKQPKKGFPTPLRFWFRNELKEWLIKRLTSNNNALHFLFKDEWLTKFCYDYINSYKKNIRVLDEIQTQIIWQLICLESWLRQYNITNHE